MNKFEMRFHHIGLATQNEAAALSFLTNIGYVATDATYDPMQKVNLRMCYSDFQPDIELITKSNEDGPLKNILKKNHALVYHICYLSKDIERSLNSMRFNGLRVCQISQGKPAILFDLLDVSFYMIKGIGLVEIIHGK